MRRLIFELIESVRIAAAQIRANKMRSLLTALGVIIGIVAVTLMGTAIGGIDAGVDRSLSGFGDDVFYVTKGPWREVDDWWVYRNRPEIEASYADEINDWVAEHPQSTLKVAVPAAEGFNNLTRGDYQVRGIYTLGTTADLPRISKSEMSEGRFFSAFEDQVGRDVAVIGFDVADSLFPGISPVGQTVRIRDVEYEVVGVAARQGSFLGIWSWDSMVAVPLNSFRRHFSVRRAGQIRVQYDVKRADEAREELTGLMRRIRSLGPEQKNDFEINEQKAIREQLDPIKRGIALAGLSITGLSLLVGAIGIMNITYVSVKERTREIGTRKALGARRRTILLQFLIEAVSICVVGGVVGLGIAWSMARLTVVIAPSFPLVFSMTLVAFAIAVSVATGVLSGFLPAWSASRLDPVEALRYE